MASPVLRVYWDTSVFLSFINSATEAQRHHVCVDILKHAKEGKVVICTSTFTIAEVVRPKGTAHPLPLSPQEVSDLNGMFQWPWVKKYQVDENVAMRAAKIARDTNLKPADSIHVATAIAAACDVLQRWDRDFDKVKSLIRVEDPVLISPVGLFDPV